MDSKDSQEKTTWRIKVHNLLSKTEEKGTELRVAKKEAKSLVSWSFELQKSGSKDIYHHPELQNGGLEHCKLNKEETVKEKTLWKEYHLTTCLLIN